MGAGYHGGFGATEGANSIINQLPSNTAQIRHIFADREGHLLYNKKNKDKVVQVANKVSNYSGMDKYGNGWYSEIQSNGTQIWVKTHRGIISDAGINKTPRQWDKETGFNNNPKRNNTWRKSK